MRRALPAAFLLCTLAVTSGCGDSSDDGPTDGPSGAADGPSSSGPSSSGPASSGPEDGAPTSSESERTAQTIEITFAGRDVTPSGERIEVEAGQPVALVVTADAPGEIHVHSTPEQEISYSKGTETFELRLDRPGIVEVESHDLEKVIVQLEVR